MDTPFQRQSSCRNNPQESPWQGIQQDGPNQTGFQKWGGIFVPGWWLFVPIPEKLKILFPGIGWPVFLLSGKVFFDLILTQNAPKRKKHFQRNAASA